MKPKSRGPAFTLGEFRAQHEAKGHRTYFDAAIHMWRIHRCGDCTFKFYVLNTDAARGEAAPGEEWVWD